MLVSIVLLVLPAADASFEALAASCFNLSSSLIDRSTAMVDALAVGGGFAFVARFFIVGAAVMEPRMADVGRGGSEPFVIFNSISPMKSFATAMI